MGGAEGDTVEYEVSDCLALVSTFRAGRGFGLRDVVEVVIQGGMSRPELDQEAGLGPGEGGCKVNKLLGGEGGVDAGQRCGTG